MDIKEVINFNIKVMESELNVETLSGNVEKQSFYKGTLYALRGLLAHPIFKELPETPTNKQSMPCSICGKDASYGVSICFDCNDRMG